MTEIIDIPANIARRITVLDFFPSYNTGSGGVGASGREQVLAAENSVWLCRLGFGHMPDELRLPFRAFTRRLKGRRNTLRVPVCNRGTLRNLGDIFKFYSDAGVSSADVAAGSLPYDDGARFSDGAGFALPSPTAKVVATTPVGASTLTVSGYLGSSLAEGAYFSHNEFLYEVDRNEGGVLTFIPPLRREVEAGEEIEVSRPTVLMQLDDDNAFRNHEKNGRLGAPITVELREDWHRV